MRTFNGRRGERKKTESLCKHDCVLTMFVKRAFMNLMIVKKMRRLTVDMSLERDRVNLDTFATNLESSTHSTPAFAMLVDVPNQPCACLRLHCVLAMHTIASTF
jgi:hypothetical protein